MLNLLYQVSNIGTVVLLVFYVFALLFAMTVHEYSHAVAAYKEGDLTATVLGRKSLNPFKHVDILGLITLFVFGFGWAKPVPVDPRNYKNGRKSEAKVAFAGIKTNLIIGIACLFIAQFLFVLYTSIESTYTFLIYIIVFLNVLAQFNISFGVFNLLPLYPLDGYRLLASAIGENNAFMRFMQKYNFIILLVLLLTGVLFYVITALNGVIINSFSGFFEYIWRGILV